MAQKPEDTTEGAPAPNVSVAQETEEGATSNLAGCVNAVAGGSWWGGIVQVAKNTSVSAIDFVKKDLVEFTATMQSESESLATNVRTKLTHENAVAATQKVKQGMSVLIDGIKTALIIPPEDLEDDDAEPLTVSGGQFFDRAKARLHAVQIDPSTYCNEPSGAPSDFERWKTNFNLESKKGDISELLVANVQVRALYTQLVPASVSHSDFWQRYFYKLHQLDQEEQRRDNLKKRADDVKVEDDLAWDDEDDWDNMNTPAQEQSASEVSKGQEATAMTEGDNNKENLSTSGDTVSQVNTKDSDKPDSPSPPTTQSESPVVTPESSTPAHTDAPVTSPSDNVSESSVVTDTDPARLSSTDTLTVVTAETTPDIPEKALAASDTTDQSVAAPVSPPTSSDNQTPGTDYADGKDKGDIEVIETASSDNMSAPSSDNSNTKETDDDWEKDFDIEVSEEELSQLKNVAAKDLVAEIKDEDDEDWENWE